MRIQHLTLHRFGAVAHYEAELSPEINLIDGRYAEEIATAISLLLCSCPPSSIPKSWLRKGTYLSALVHLAGDFYAVSAKFVSGRLQLSAAAPSGIDDFARYRYAISHCPEQNALEAFDGRNKSLSRCLGGYYQGEDRGDLSSRTEGLVATKTFRAFLMRYIKTFQPERINCQKAYQIAINPTGQFYVMHPDFPGSIHLSETEEKLFLYSCFLNIAEFWTDFEKIRDLHYEKKPLVIQNFIEFLDEATDIRRLIARTRNLERQIILLTYPLNQETKEKWVNNI